MAKITSKPKKTPEQEAKELEELLSGVSVTSGAGMPPQQSGPGTSPGSTAEVEQKGEKAPATPAAAIANSPANPPAPVAASPEATPTPAAETISPPAPPSVPAAVKPEPQADSPAAAPAPAVVEAPPEPAVAQSPAPASSPAAPAPAPAAETELTDDEPETEPADTEPGTSGGGNHEMFDLANLFVPNPPGSKKSTCRLTAQHHQYLLMLGTLLGNGMSPPEILHNIVEQFIASQDKQVQKAITKQMRQVRNAALSSSRKS